MSRVAENAAGHLWGEHPIAMLIAHLFIIWPVQFMVLCVVGLVQFGAWLLSTLRQHQSTAAPTPKP